MNNRELQNFNSECENAIIDKPFHDNMATWVKAHHGLYTKSLLLIQNGHYLNALQEKINFIVAFNKLYTLSFNLV